MAKRGYFFAITILFICLGVFLKNAAPTIFPGDSPEIITGVLTLSVLHGLSFPLYILLANLFKYLPLGSLAWRVNQFSLLCGVAAVFVLMMTERFLPEDQANKKGWQSQLRALWLVFLLLSSSAFKYQVIRAEVYILYACFFLLLVWLAVKTGQDTRGRKFWFLIIILAAGLSSDVHIYLSVPLCVIMLASGVLFRQLKGIKVVFFSLFVFFLALSVYLYLPLRASSTPPINFGDPQSLAALKSDLMSFDDFLRPEVDIGVRLKNYLSFFREQMSLPFIFLVVPGFFIYLRKNWRLGTVLALIGAVNVLVYFRHVDFSPTHLDTLGFELVAIIVFTLFSGIALFSLAAMLARNSPLLKLAISGAITLLLFYRVAVQWSGLDERNNFLAYRFAADTINSVGKGHLLMKGNTLTFPLSYLVHVEDRGRRIKFYNPFDGGVFPLVEHPARYSDREFRQKQDIRLREILNERRPLYSGMMPFNYQNFNNDLNWRISGLAYRQEDDNQFRPLSRRFLHWPKGKKFPFENKSRRIIATYLYRGGEVAFQQESQDTERGSRLWEEAAAYAYDDAVFLSDLGISFLERNAVGKGIKLIERGLKINPRIEAGYSNLGMAYYYGRGDRATALRHVFTALKINPEDPGGRYLYHELTGQVFNLF